jgi:hypothetical protein
LCTILPPGLKHKTSELNLVYRAFLNGLEHEKARRNRFQSCSRDARRIAVRDYKCAIRTCTKCNNQHKPSQPHKPSQHFLPHFLRVQPVQWHCLDRHDVHYRVRGTNANPLLTKYCFTSLQLGRNTVSEAPSRSRKPRLSALALALMHAQHPRSFTSFTASLRLQAPWCCCQLATCPCNLPNSLTKIRL